VAQLTRPDTLWAAERTLLAWVRTGVAMMGFGFVVARLSIQTGQDAGFASIVGIALAVLGGLLNTAATIRYRSHVRHLRAGRDPTADVFLPTAVGVGSAVIGGALAIALLR
jgi:putative membrane protein